MHPFSSNAVLLFSKLGENPGRKLLGYSSFPRTENDEYDVVYLSERRNVSAIHTLF